MYKAELNINALLAKFKIVIIVLHKQQIECL